MNESPGFSACDREPIHVPGLVQSHGLMLVADGAGTIVQGAGDIETILGVEDWLGRPLADLVGGEIARRALDEGAQSAGLYVGRIADRDAAHALDVSSHGIANRIVVEIEPTRDVEASAAAMLGAVESASDGFQRARSLTALCERAATEFQRLTGYDRIMIYRFLDDEAGVVVAEARTDAISSFLNHHFPASDIPRQARALYVRNLVRVIPDVSSAPQPLRPADGPVLDMSDCALRAVSPVHIQYLRNMGVAASASISIVMDGILWGLVACHNSEPRHLPFQTRAACRALAGSLSRQIKAMEEAESYRQRIRLRSFEDDIVSHLLGENELAGALAGRLDEMRRMLEADGAVVLCGEKILTAGRCPSEEKLRELLDFVRPQSAYEIFATESLSRESDIGAEIADVASGVLAITVADTDPFVVVWLRAERVEEIRWAGDPHKDVPLDPTKPLTPRASFAAWTETVRGHSRPWSSDEKNAASRLRHALVEVRQRRQMRALNRELQQTLTDKNDLLQQKDYLLKEVNHRVQNSLQLVGSFLMLQARQSDDPALRQNLHEADRRLGAVALVHRRLHRADQVEVVDLSRYLEELCKDMLHSMGTEWGDQIRFELAPILMPPERAISLGLVVTELVINANKYAYGGAAGPIEIVLEQQRRNFRLVVADKGRGKTDDTQGFGTRMMAAMVRQLSGDISYRSNDPGLRVILTAPIESV